MQTPSTLAGSCQIFPGRSNNTAINNEKDTKGAQAGAVMAMVVASDKPITMPAISGPKGLPKPPIMTAENTTPIQP
jgi:hypothetical protein